MEKALPTKAYQHLIEKHTAERKQIAQRKNRIAWARLAAIIAAGLAFYFLLAIGLWAAIGGAVIFLAVFLRLVVLAVNTQQQLDRTTRLIRINEEELEIAAGNYMDKPDGAAYLPATHPYAYDLDILGRASLFQYIDRSTTEQGSSTLAAWLLQPADETTITQRQLAAKELATKTAWMQQLQASGQTKNITTLTEDKITGWLAEEDVWFQKPVWKIIRWVGPAIALTILACYVVDIISYQVFLLWLAFFFIVTGYISKKATPAYHALGKISEEVGTLSSLIQHIENEKFESSWLQQQQQFFLQKEEKASVAVRTLNRILSRLDYRLNPVVFIPLNIFLFWDLQQMLAFEKWKKKNADSVEKWFAAVGAIEALSSIGTLTFNQPKWAFPAIKQEHGFFEAVELGHPLIPAEKVVRSSFATNGQGKVVVITGSNMAGKSTFLRSIGLALVMGQAGLPVCAVQAAFACMQVMSTMRISDNLEESTSTFYAELKKLKSIIDAVNQKQKVFLLMDEILRGTNSLDRHTGSEALIKQLIQHQASGIIATHDLSLAALEKAYPNNIDNYHFDVQVAGEELYFDYKLKTGICQSLNASVLMKKIGIEM